MSRNDYSYATGNMGGLALYATCDGFFADKNFAQLEEATKNLDKHLCRTIHRLNDLVQYRLRNCMHQSPEFQEPAFKAIMETETSVREQVEETAACDTSHQNHAIVEEDITVMLEEILTMRVHAHIILSMLKVPLLSRLPEVEQDFVVREEVILFHYRERETFHYV